MLPFHINILHKNPTFRAQYSVEFLWHLDTLYGLNKICVWCEASGWRNTAGRKVPSFYRHELERFQLSLQNGWGHQLQKGNSKSLRVMLTVESVEENLLISLFSLSHKPNLSQYPPWILSKWMSISTNVALRLTPSISRYHKTHSHFKSIKYGPMRLQFSNSGSGYVFHAASLLPALLQSEQQRAAKHNIQSKRSWGKRCRTSEVGFLPALTMASTSKTVMSPL